MRKIILFAAGLAVLVSQPAFANRDCLVVSQIDSWKVTDDKTMIVQDNSHDRFKVALMGTCPGLSFKERVGFKSMGATALSCLGVGDDVVIRSLGFGHQVCPIRTIVAYTPDMEKADQAAAAAKAAGAAPAAGDSGSH